MDAQGANHSRQLSFGRFMLDRDDERLHGPTGPVKLGNKAYRLLVELIEQYGRLLTKEAIFSSVWDGTIVSESALTSAVKELRRALGDASRTPEYIESVYGRGYRFIAEVRRVEAGLRLQEKKSNAAEKNLPLPVAPFPEAEARPPMVIVSEFDDSAVKTRHPHCGPGLREEVLSGLARFRDIQLLADERPDDASRSRSLARGYRLSARLLPEAEGVKVIARAVRLADGLVLWAESLSLADTGTSASVERIVRRIIGAALPAVDEDLFLGLSRASGAFYDRYVLAKRQSLLAASFDAAKAAAEELERLVAERPDFGLAYPPLVRLYNTDFGYTALGSTGSAERARALTLARAGLSADRANVHAYTVLGFCHLYHRQHALARSCFDRALALNPYNAARLNEVASGMVYFGEFQAARSLLDMSLHLQTFADDSFNEDMGRLNLLEGECDAAREALDSILGHSLWAELYSALCALRSGLEEGETQFGAWRERVHRSWHSGAAPSPLGISQWVRHHHPFRADVGAPLFDAVDLALGLSNSARRPSPARQ